MEIMEHMDERMKEIEDLSEDGLEDKEDFEEKSY
jgi:hypothetical protein